MKEKFNDFRHIFKKIFLLSILILIIIEFRKIGRTVNPLEIKKAFESLSIFPIILMGLVGLISNIPAIFYDFILNKRIGNEFDKKYIGETAFCINNFNDLLGLGGFISIGLRSAFYGKDSSVKKIMELLLFLPTGLSFFSILSLLLLKTYPDTSIRNYKILLSLSSLYIVFILVFSRKIDFSLKSKFLLFLTSIAEWLGVIGSFLLIGYFSGIEFNFLSLFPLVVVANIIGYISMIPGSLGSFDLVILYALTSQGIDKEVGLMWILLYRIFYYILPFFLACFYFFKNFDRAFSFKNEDLIKKILKNVIIVLNTFMLYIFGIFMILSATLPDKIDGSYLLTKINPVRAEVILQFPSLLFGFVFIIMARAFISRQERAKFLNIAILILALVYTIFTGYSMFTIFYLILMLIISLITRKEMYTRQFLYASEDRIVDLTLANFMVLVYVLRILRPNIFLNVNLTSDFYLLPFEESLLSIILRISFIYLVSFILIRYLKGDRVKIGEKFDMEKFEDFVQNKRGSKEAFLALLKDKDMYYYKEDGENKALLQIKTLRDKIVVMGHPLGDEKYFDALIDSFINEADLYGYNIVFYEIDKNLSLKLHDYGFNFMKFGESASLDLSKFSLEGKSRKNLRKTVNKLTRLGLTFEVLSHPHDEKILNELKEISQAWLDGKKEKGFSLGFFDKDYLNRSDIAIVKDKGEIIAFANLPENYLDSYSTVDLMRYKKNYDGLMDYLFINIFSYYKEKDMKYFDLGMAPFYNVGIMKHSFLQEKLVYLAYKLGSSIYSFEGLKTYKSKYADNWDERYLSYSKGSNLFFSSLSLLYLINKR